MRIEQEIELFKNYTQHMAKVFAAKRNDYGQTTTETIEKYGMVSMLVRMRDKLGRLDNLLIEKAQREVWDESVEDTLLDLANYAIIALIELRKINDQRISSRIACDAIISPEV